MHFNYCWLGDLGCDDDCTADCAPLVRGQGWIKRATLVPNFRSVASVDQVAMMDGAMTMGGKRCGLSPCGVWMVAALSIMAVSATGAAGAPTKLIIDTDIGGGG